MSMQAAAPEKTNLFQRIGYSIFPGLMRPKRDKQDYRGLFNTLILHFRPRTVPERTLRFTLTWGLGGMAVVLILLLFGTGILMKFVYQPFPDKAYASILHLQRDVLFGQFIRNIHHWSGNILLIVVFLHFLRVFFTGAFHPPRQFNWVIGLFLFLAVLMSSFTGYLLPWDQLSFWAVTICTGMLEYIPGVGLWLQRLIRGGSEVGASTLSNFYAIHTAILPAALILLMPFHFWRVRKAGGLVVPRAPQEDPGATGDRVPGIPNLLLREVVTALVLIALVLMMSVYFNAPLAGKANPGLSPNPTKAPWYFMGFQEILLHMHPFITLCVVPAVMALVLLSMPYVRYPSRTAGVWFGSATGRRSARDAAVFAVVATPLGILLDEHIVELAAWMPGLPPAIRNGLLPLIGVLSVCFGAYVVLKRKHGTDKMECVQMIFVFFLTAFIILTMTGIWLRGPGMRLSLPWMR